MASLNRVTLIGRVGKEPEIQAVGSGKVAKFSLAISEKFKNKEGAHQEKTEWVNIVIWNRLAEIVEQYVKKGSLIYLEGKIQTRSWEQDGVKRYSTEVVCFSMQMLGSKGDSNQEPSQASQAPPEDQELPF